MAADDYEARMPEKPRQKTGVIRDSSIKNLMDKYLNQRIDSPARDILEDEEWKPLKPYFSKSIYA